MPTPPPLPPERQDLTIAGFGIGHGSDLEGKTGVTVVLCPDGAVAAADLRGSATGTRQFDSLIHPHHIANRAHALVLAGGSGFGLDCGGPVADELARRGKGFATGLRPVPLVPTAILFDLAFGDPNAAPGPELVRRALASADGFEPGSRVPTGSVGAGTGATVGKALGPASGMKSGIGFASYEVPGGVTVAALVAVNAFGDVHDPEKGTVIAGCRTEPDGHELAHAERVLAALPPETEHVWEGNTTLAVVLTDAALSKLALTKVCHMAFGGLYRTIRPCLSLYDGDLVAALSTATKPAHLHQVAVLAEQAVAGAVISAVRDADGFGLLPTARDLAH
ncbi:MAG: P1 family peptidase [Acidobacteria bacterium]|nr:P1 family peptidase [Acidobacteriota bacterium]